MGRIVAPFGVKGWVKVKPLTAEAQTLLSHRKWWLRSRGAASDWQGHELAAGRMHGGNLLVQLEGIGERESAAKWSGAEVGVPRDSLPEAAEGEIYWADLEGLAVVNRQQVALGRVVTVEEFGAHPVLRVVDDAGATRLIPYVDAIVIGIDLRSRQVEVDWQPDY